VSRIIVHIGLPKTATTSLQQDLFPRLAHGSLLYLGVYQPRQAHQQNRLFQEFCEVVNGMGNLARLRNEIASTIAEGRSILLSEEMFTVSRQGFSWRQKLTRLSELLRDFDYEILVTVREPAEALFSFYTEAFPRFSFRGSFIDCALEDDEMHIYHYGELTHTLLDRFGRTRVKIFRFEDIVSGDIQGIVDAIHPGFSIEQGFTLERKNSRDTKGGSVVSRHRFTIADLIHYPYRKLGLNRIEYMSSLKQTFQPLTSLLGNVTLHRISVQRPTESEMSYLRNHLRSENAVLKREFQISYD